MKKIIFAITLLASNLLYMGCNDWLDVKPQSQVAKDELFETQRGFRSALTGAYIRMKSGNIYGGSLMWGDIEYMACNWYNSNASNTTIAGLINCDYTNEGVRNAMDRIYENLYKVIADVNSILEEIDNKKEVFSDNNYEITKGESLALRAFCHFDVLRMFGPMPHGADTETQLLPYVKTVTKDIHPHLSYTDFVRNMLDDLDTAELLLKESDPILNYSLEDLKNLDDGNFTDSDDTYLSYRQIRMNYYAVLAIKARVYLWLSAQEALYKAHAAEYAQMVIDAVDPTGTPTFRLGKDQDRVNGDYTMSPEHILALHVYNLETIANNSFGENGNYVRYDFNITDGFYYLNNLFPVGERTSDVRWKDMWSYRTLSGQTNYVMYKKFTQNPDRYKQILQIPLLRLSEMYLILTECAGTKAEAEIPYLFYCGEKGIPFSGFSNTDWEADRRNKLIREYVREFYAEGQTFFTYKRFSVTSLPAMWANPTFTGSPAKYVVPKPLREIEYHNN